MSDRALVFSQCVDLETQIGEGPVWDVALGVLWFVDILAPALFAYDPADGTLARHDMPDLVTSIGLTVYDGRLILSLRTAVYLFDTTTGALDLFATPDVGAPVNRLNDGKVGPDGCFWVGSMHEGRPAQPTAALYRITPNGRCSTVAQGLRVSNGLAWSPEGRVMYHADSRGPHVTAYDFDPASGEATSPRLFAQFDEAAGLPDGAAVDMDCNYWSAGVTAGCLNVFSPEGARIRRIAVPMAAPTMPCFGGPDMRTLFVTGLTRKLEDGTVSPGRLLSCRTDVAGTPAMRFGAQPILF